MSTLRDAVPAPELGVDGERYTGPVSWLGTQLAGDVETYDKLKAKLESKFRANADNLSTVILHLTELERKDRTVRDFADDLDDIRGATGIPDLF
jgi:hypothetical protein